MNGFLRVFQQSWIFLMGYRWITRWFHPAPFCSTTSWERCFCKMFQLGPGGLPKPARIDWTRNLMLPWAVCNKNLQQSWTRKVCLGWIWCGCASWKVSIVEKWARFFLYIAKTPWNTAMTCLVLSDRKRTQFRNHPVETRFWSTQEINIKAPKWASFFLYIAKAQT